MTEVFLEKIAFTAFVCMMLCAATGGVLGFAAQGRPWGIWVVFGFTIAAFVCLLVMIVCILYDVWVWS